MADKFEEFDFEHYELIPRDETLRKPISDQLVIMNSKPYSISRASLKTQETQTQSNNHNSQLRQKELNEKEITIQSLNFHIARVQNQLVQKRRQNNYLIQRLQNIKQLMENPNLTIQQAIQQIQTLKNNLQKQKAQKITLNQQIKNNKNEQNIKLLSQKQQQIHELKAKLLQSTTNNINAIFNTQICQNKIQKTIYTQICQLKQQIKKIYWNLTYKNECKHEQKIIRLIKNYQQMLTLYHKNQRNVEQLQNKHHENIIYFSTLRREINNQINQLYTNNTNKKLYQLQIQINEIVDNLKNKPQTVRTQQEEDVKVKQLMNQLQILNQRLMHREIQVEKMREANQQLMMRSRAYQKCQFQLSKMKQIQDKVKQKDKKISQLQYTIIQQMQSKVRTQSINSQQSDMQKQKNNVRNLKVIVSSLKQQNAALKAQLNNLSRQNKTLKQATNASSSPQSDYLAERSIRDDVGYKAVENVVGVLIMASEGDQRGKCRCLEMVTDCLLNLNQEYPCLQGMLQNLGVMQKTSNLLPIQA